VVGMVEPDNLAAIRCVQSCGFVPAIHGLDEEGFLHFEYNPVRKGGID
jgi:hypothetical protein